MRYRRFRITSTETGRIVGTVEAQTGKEAIYRLMGGDYGRADYIAEDISDF